jgi:uncharacterized protein DUF4199
MFKVILRYGTVAGLIVAVPMLWQMLTVKAGDGNPLGGMLVGYLTMLVALTAVFLGIKHYRDKVLGGAIRFLPAFGLGLGISVVASLFYVLGWEISMRLSDFDFMTWYSNVIMSGAKGGTPEQVAKAAADAAEFRASYSNPLWRIPMTFAEIFPVGLLVSLISAAVLRNSRVLPVRST